MTNVWYLDSYYKKTSNTIEGEKISVMTPSPSILTSCHVGQRLGTGLFTDPDEMCCHMDPSLEGETIKKITDCSAVNDVPILNLYPIAVCLGDPKEQGTCSVDAAEEGCRMGFVSSS